MVWTYRNEVSLDLLNIHAARYCSRKRTGFKGTVEEPSGSWCTLQVYLNLKILFLTNISFQLYSPFTFVPFIPMTNNFFRPLHCYIHAACLTVKAYYSKSLLFLPCLGLF